MTRSTPIIEVKDLSKRYDITHQRGGYIALRDVITNTLKNPFKFLKHKAKTILGRDIKEEFWALKDINFTVHKGEAIGIIGANGAGKSTLLKILSRITPPTTGEVILRGRVASLLEVGTGFHPELTGRENIFLNGAILGMSSKEMAKKFDDIVKFSGVEKFLDTPVKRYSSGMYVRLAFSVAAHMEPDILIVDEVLAVGDAEFQKKCLGKMDEVAKSEGRTVLFVSHNMNAIQKLCKRTVLIEQGKVKMIGDTKEVIASYLEGSSAALEDGSLKERRDRKGLGNIKIVSFFIEQSGKKVDYAESGGKYSLCFEYETLKEIEPENVLAAVGITDGSGSPIFLASTAMKNQNFKKIPKNGTIKCLIDQKFPLISGVYTVSVDLHVNGLREDHIKNAGAFEVRGGDFYGTGFESTHSPVLVEHEWSVGEIK